MGPDHPGIGVGGVKVHHVIRDVYSGARIAYPITKRDIAAHAKNLRHFLGLRTSDKAPHVLVKHDEAQELGLLPETSLPNRFPFACLSLSFDRVDEDPMGDVNPCSVFGKTSLFWSVVLLSQEDTNKKNIGTKYVSCIVSWLAY